MRRAYGAHPLHLLSLVGCFALAGYAALQASRGPLPLRMGLWFLGALIAHDLVLFPLYALSDRLVGKVLPGGSVNYLRVPALLSGLLLLVFYPVILRRSEYSYGVASGLDQSPFLHRWLLITGALFLGSAVLYVLRLRRTR